MEFGSAGDELRSEPADPLLRATLHRRRSVSLAARRRRATQDEPAEFAVVPGDERGRGVEDEAGRLFALWRERPSRELAERIFDLTVARLRLYAGALLPDPNDVDDAVQETFLAAFENPRGWSSERPLVPWLLGVLRHRVLNTVRTERRRRSREVARSAREAVGDHTLEAAEVVRAIERGIAALPTTYRDVVARRVIDGADYAAIAQRLGRPETTVRVQASRGLRMLRDALPAGIGAAVAVAMLPGRSAAAMRSAVAAARPREPSLPLARLWRPAWLATVAALAVVSLALVAFAGRGSRPTAAPDATVVAVRAEPDGIRAAQVVALPALGGERVEVVAPPRGEIVIELRADGRPVPGVPVDLLALGDAAVFVTAIEDRYGRRVRIDTAASGATGRSIAALTDADGACRFDLVAGRYLVRIPIGGAVIEAGAGPDHYRVDVTGRLVVVRGEVVGADGRPAAASLWVCDGPDATASVETCRTDADGRFTLALPRGATLEARAGTQCSPPRQLEAEEPDHLDGLQLALAPGAMLRGRVIGPGGGGLRGIAVEVQSGVRAARAVSDATGRFEIPGLDPGLCVVRARDEHAAGSARTELRAGEATELALQLETTATVVGRVCDTAGRPLANTRVQTGWSSAGLDAVVAATDADGRYELHGVMPGAVVLTAGLGADGCRTVAMELAPGETRTWDVALSPGDLHVTGRVTGVRPRGTLLIAIDAQNHLQPTLAPVAADGTFDVAVPPFDVWREQFLRVYPADAISADGRVVGFPLATLSGIRAGDTGVELALPADLARDGAVGARVTAPPGLTGRLRVQSLDQQVWLDVGGIDEPGCAVDVAVERLPAGRYALVLEGGSARAEFALGRGERREFGDLRLGVLDAGQRVPVVLLFEHPGGGAPMGRLDVAVHDTTGRCVARGAGPGGAGQWRIGFDLPLGELSLTAQTGMGLAASQPLRVARDGPAVVRVPLVASER
ncbi:MAG: sigma-70 family RNA polymerase sigma factor [Planctomycetes bacterium]|nr:sigma-70 family RNA polymerase sigma factor [Planctomycetota bacterium]